MSRKRVSPFKRLFSNASHTPSIEVYQYGYYRPGCYYIPQVVHEVTPYNYTYLTHWQPCCHTATYVVDRSGIANYSSDFEYQLQVPTHMQSQPKQLIYNYYENGHGNISSLPQIEEEDFIEEHDVSVRKRKRLNEDNKLKNQPSPVLRNSYSDNLYRSEEGYLVEEPNENVPEDF